MAWTKEGRAKWQAENVEKYMQISRDSQTKRRRRLGIPIRAKNPSLTIANQRPIDKEKEMQIKAKVLEVRKSIKMQVKK